MDAVHSMTSHGPVENPGQMKIRSLLHNLFSTKRPWELNWVISFRVIHIKQGHLFSVYFVTLAYMEKSHQKN